MVPAACLVIPEWPLTPSGKVDRRALPAPDGGRPSLDTPFVAAGDELERAIASLWRGVLQLQAVGVGDNFFEVGGDSLLMVQVQSGLRETLGRDVPIVDLFRHPTIRALAGHLAGVSGEARGGRPGARTRERQAIRRQGERRRQLRPRQEEQR
jgi:aryl carrier-like protein